MYPTISDLIYDIFGLYIPLPIQSFGFMLAISFLCAAYTLQLELRRKEKLGIIRPFLQKTITGEPASTSELAGSFLMGFILGFKLIYLVFNYAEFVDNTQEALLSTKGSWPGGLITGAVSAYMRYRDKEKHRLAQPKLVEETVYPHQLVGNFTMIAAVSGILGAKIFHNLENLHEFETDPLEALLSFSGLTMYGGLIFGTVAVSYYGWKKGVRPLVMADATAPGLMLAYGTGRLGCQIAGDGDWGIVNPNPKPGWLNWLPDWAWSYNYPNNVINEGIPIPGCTGKHCMVLPDFVYPTPLYEAVLCILLFGILWMLRKKFSIAGKLFCVYLILNGFERLLIEQIRINNKFEVAGFLLTQAEIIAGSLILAGVAGFTALHFKKTKPQYPVT